jgi:protein-S-isoprenylcysteine O-methyltransferase Ste14
LSLTTPAADHTDALLKATRDQIEDFVGRALLTAFWFTSLPLQIGGLVRLLYSGEGRLGDLLDILHTLLLITFTTLAAWLTVTRRPAKAVATGIEPRVTAFVGSFLLFVWPFLPVVGTPINLQMVALPITMLGLFGAICCMFWLGRSYAVMASARSLVTGGPYSIVRHPLYATELVMVAGLTLWNLSVTSMALLVASTLLQLRRAYHEEKVLRAAFPEYDDYARRVPRIIPGFH